MADVDLRRALEHVELLEREVAQVKRDLLRSLAGAPPSPRKVPSLFGSVRGGDVTDEMIADAKRSLFRGLAET